MAPSHLNLMLSTPKFKSRCSYSPQPPHRGLSLCCEGERNTSDRHTELTLGPSGLYTNMTRNTKNLRKPAVLAGDQVRRRIFSKSRSPLSKRSTKMDSVSKNAPSLLFYQLTVSLVLPDLTKEDNVALLDRWEKSWSFLSNMSWIRVSPSGSVKPSSFPPKH
jgi:hypothetical protein